METIHASVNKNTCIGCGICIGICPGVFEFDPHGLSEATVTAINPSWDQSLKEAAKACPTNAITIS